MKLKQNIYMLLLSIFIAACSGYEPEVSVGPRPDLTTAEVLAANDYSILVEAIQQTGIDVGTGNTLFAPTNQAFQKLFAQLGVQSVGEIDNATLTAVLQYHVVTGEALSETLESGELETVSGTALNVVVTADGININGRASVIDPDRVSANGVIHGINQVLSEPTTNLVATLQADANFSILAAAITAAGLESALNSANYTVFAPNDDAFLSVGLDEATITSIPQAVLAEILSFHVIAGKTFSQQLPESARIETILGDEDDGFERLIYNDGEFTTYFSGRTNSTSVIGQVNILATNAVIHEVDAPLFMLGSLLDLIDPATDTPRSGGDNGGPPNDLDNTGAIVNGVSYPLPLGDTLTLIIPADAPLYSSFATDADATDYLERHIFEGSFNIQSLDNGDRFESVGGDEYYAVLTLNGSGNEIIRVNGTSTDRFGAYSMYNGPGYRYTSSFNPIPDTDVLTALNNEGYTLFAAIVELLELEGALNSGDNTIFAITNERVEDLFGAALTPAQILGITSESTIAFLEELALNHVAAGANFSAYYNVFLPELTAASGEDLFLAETVKVETDEITGETTVTPIIAIILDQTDVVNSAVEINNEASIKDVIYANGIIQRVEGYILFD